MKYFSSLKIIKCGQVRKLYDIGTGKRVRHLSDIENGMNLALSSFDPFKKSPYKIVDLLQGPTIVKKEPDVRVGLMVDYASCKVFSKWGFLSYWTDCDLDQKATPNSWKGTQKSYSRYTTTLIVAFGSVEYSD
jgi:hypothetical protein